MLIVASATDTLESWPTQATLSPLGENDTECTQPPGINWVTLMMIPEVEIVNIKRLVQPVLPYVR